MINMGDIKNGFVVTTTRKEDTFLQAAAEARAAEFSLPFVPRRGLSIGKLLDELGARAAWVVSDGPPMIRTRGGRLFYHQNTSALRLRGAGPNPLSRALELRPGDHALDCTFGLGFDALVIAANLEDGDVTGLESNYLLHLLAVDGLRNYAFTTKRLTAAAKRIKPVFADHREYLNACADASFDVVYFDPFFEETVPASPSIRVMREIAEVRGLDAAAVERARRVARRRVVVKGRRGVFGEIRFDEIIKAGRSTFYGVIGA